MQPGLPDFGAIFAQAQQMQSQMEQASAALTEAELTGSAGGGVVTAVVDGNGELKALDMDAEVVDPNEIETLADLIVAAVRDASRQAAELRERAMNPMTGGLVDSLSGLGLALPGFGSTVDALADSDDDEFDLDADEDEDGDVTGMSEEDAEEQVLDGDVLIDNALADDVDGEMDNLYLDAPRTTVGPLPELQSTATDISGVAQSDAGPRTGRG